LDTDIYSRLHFVVSSYSCCLACVKCAMFL